MAVVPERRYPHAVTSWSDFLAGPKVHGHAVQIYRDVADLADSVAEYFDAGLTTGAAALLVATDDHRRVFLARVAERGWDTERLVAEGRLVCKDAHELLEQFMRGGFPSPSAFDDVVGGLIDDLVKRFPHAEPRVFGEMVDVLVRAGSDDAAISLEELWNSLRWSRRFSLLCGYELDVFSREDQTSRLPEICRTHTHIKPDVDARRLALAVDSALEDVLGTVEAGKIYVVVSEQLRKARIPSPQLVLMWVSEHMPAHAEKILQAARAHYAAA